MPNLLEEIGRGLRLAGGVASPGVFEANVAEDRQRRELAARSQERFRQIKEQRTRLIMEMVARGVENGSVTPETAQTVAQHYGFSLPQMGPSASTQKIRKQEAEEQRLKTQHAGWEQEFAQQFPGLVARPGFKRVGFDADQGYDVNQDLEGGTDTDMMRRYGGDGGPGGVFGDPLPGPAAPGQPGPFIKDKGPSTNEPDTVVPVEKKPVSASEFLRAARFWAGRDKDKAKLFLELYKETRTRPGKPSGR